MLRSFVAIPTPCHFGHFAAMAAALARWLRPSRSFVLEDSRRGVASGGVSDRPKKR
jgi:hypothetical protein